MNFVNKFCNWIMRNFRKETITIPEHFSGEAKDLIERLDDRGRWDLQETLFDSYYGLVDVLTKDRLFIHSSGTMSRYNYPNITINERKYVEYKIRVILKAYPRIAL